jgi:hypothetical protein
LFVWVFHLFCQNEVLFSLICILISVLVEMLMCWETGKRITNLICLAALSLPIIHMCAVCILSRLKLYYCSFLASSNLYVVKKKNYLH